MSTLPLPTVALGYLIVVCAKEGREVKNVRDRDDDNEMVEATSLLIDYGGYCSNA
jgi:hypothetical protein